MQSPAAAAASSAIASAGRLPDSSAKHPTPPAAQGAEAAEMADAAPSDDSDDEVADFRNLLPQLIADRDASKEGAAAAAASISIPKRGEKDFEPTGFKGQEKKLEESRRAMEMVIGQKRRTPNKTMSVAVWHPELNRAILDVAKGTTIASMGVTARHPVTVSSASEIPSTSSDTLGPGNQVGVWKAGIFYPRYTSRVELLPEEALFLMERGTLECRLPTKLSDSEEEVFIPLSLQHAFSLMMGKDGCTRERYQVYAYLKRLGYYVQRCSITDALRAAKKQEMAGSNDHDIPTPSDKVAAQGIVADPRRPLRLVSLFDLFLYIPRRIAQIFASGTSALVAWIMRVAGRVRQSLPGSKPSVAGTSSATAPRSGPATDLLGLNAQQMSSYDSLYSALQIIPSGHDLAPAKPRNASNVTAVATPTGESDPFIPSFYAWRPATHFRKTNPPLPEFRIAVTSARDTHLPKLHQFQAMFDAVPLPTAASATGETGASPADEEERKRAAAEKKRNDESYGRGFAARKKRDELAAARLRKKQGAGAASDGDKRSESKALSSAPLRLLAFLAALLPGAVTNAAVRSCSTAQRVLLVLSHLFAHLPPGTSCTTGRASNGGRYKPQYHRDGPRFGEGGGGPRRPNPFPALKGGRRNVILAVVDHGTTSLLRFGEAEFAKLKLMGTD